MSINPPRNQQQLRDDAVRVARYSADYLTLPHYLHGLDRFALFTRGGPFLPRRALLVSSYHLNKEAWVPCIRIKIFGNARRKSSWPNSKIEVCAGIVRAALVYKYPVRVTTGKAWAQRLWTRTWGKDWKDGKLVTNESLHKLIERDAFFGNYLSTPKWLPEWRCGERNFATTYCEELESVHSSHTYLAIMLWWYFWELEKAPLASRNAELMSGMGLFGEEMADGNFSNLCKRCGCKVV